MRLFVLISFVILCCNKGGIAQQQKRNNNWVLGFQPAIKFEFSNGFTIDTFKNNDLSSPPYCATKTSSSISDTTGNLQFFSSGFIVYNKEGYAMENGIKVNCPKGELLYNTIGYVNSDQSSIILPKKGNSYYIFSTGMSDSLTNIWINSQAFPGFDVLNYSVVDMDSNNGIGKVVAKNRIVLDNQKYASAALTAVRHANNKDWWLVKADCYNHRYQKFLVKEDTILGPYYHIIMDTANFCAPYVQIYFSEDGTKFVSTVLQQTYPNSYYLEYNRADVFDFNRSTGNLTYRNYYKVPVDTTTYPWEDAVVGVCFSPDSKLLYMSTLYSVYQIDISDTNRYNAVYIHGPDTTINEFPTYHILANGVDGKLYIGNFDGTQKYMSYIDKPNIRGVGCGFKAHGIWQPHTNLMSPPNMPSYGLGQWGTYPLGLSEEPIEDSEVLLVYPNPASSYVDVRYELDENSEPRLELYNTIGQCLYSKSLERKSIYERIDVSRLPKGIYYVRVSDQSVRVVVE